MSRCKIYLYDGKRHAAYNKEQVRQRLGLSARDARVKDIKLIWCNYYATKMDILKKSRKKSRRKAI